MKITNKQALMLFEIAKGSLRFADTEESDGVFGFCYKTRKELINLILNQQGDDLINLGKESLE